MDQLWKRISPYFHVAALLFTAGVAWAGLASQVDDIVALQNKHDRLEDIVIEMRISNARIEEGVKEIKRALKVKDE